MKTYYVYILTNYRKTVFYIGVTSDLIQRTYQHRQKLVAGFTSKYNVTRLIYFERFLEVEAAICREKQLKGWRRSKKEHLVNGTNPNWNDLYSSIC